MGALVSRFRLVMNGIFREKGKFSPDQPSIWATVGARFSGQRVTVTVEKERKIRTDRQNRWYWSCLNVVAKEILNIGRDVPLSKDQTHEVLKAAFIGQEETELGPVPISSASLDTAQFATFCEKVSAWLAEKGCVLPGVGDESAWPESDEVIDRDAEAVR